MPAEKPRLTFISYSRADKDFALGLARELRASGFRIWLDQLDIPTGSRWDDEVEKALDQCEIFMVILTPHSIASNNVKDEIGYAIDCNKRIMPVLLENAILPFRLRRFQYVDFTCKSYEDGIEAAKQLLRNLISEPVLPNAAMPVDLGQTVKENNGQLFDQQKNHRKVVKGKAQRFSKGSKLGKTSILTFGIGGALIVALIAFGYLETNFILPGLSPTPAPTRTYVASLTPTIVPSSTTTLPTVETVLSDSSITHLGDEKIQNWEQLQKGCYEIAFYAFLPLKSSTLGMEVYDTDADNPISINNEFLVTIPNQNIQHGGGWATFSVAIPNNRIQQGSNSLRICPAPTTFPDFQGDLDDFQIRRIVLTIER